MRIPFFGRDSYSATAFATSTALTLLLAICIMPLLLPQTERAGEEIHPEYVKTFRKPLVSKVVVVLIDGWGMNAALKPGWMPHFHDLIKKGAFGTAEASFPTMTTNGVAAIATGRKLPSGMGFPGGLKPAPEYDSILMRAKAAGLRAFAVGQQDWQAMFINHGERLITTPYVGQPLTYDVRQMSHAMKILHGKMGPWNLLCLHLFDLDPTGHIYGMNAPEYRKKIEWLDNHLQDIITAAGPEAVVMFTADHGQTVTGTHGGIEKEVKNVPLLILGKRIVKVRFGTVDHRDIPATVAALLGTPPPALCEGLPIFKAISLTPQERAAISVQVLEQRKLRWIACRSNWHSFFQDPKSQLKHVQHLISEGKFAKAAATAQGAARRIDNAIGEISPKKWFGRLVLTVWILLFATAISLAWTRPVGFFMQTLAVAFNALIACFLFLPSLHPDLWPVASKAVMVSSGILLAICLKRGISEQADVDLFSWLGWWIALGLLACPPLVDTALWAWSAAWGICLYHLIQTARFDRKSIGWPLLSLGAVSAATLMTSWNVSTETSVIRSLLPEVNLRFFASPPWAAYRATLCLLLALAALWKFRNSPSSGIRILLSFCALALVVRNFSGDNLGGTPAPLLWILAYFSLGLFFVRTLSPKLYGLWLSMVFLISEPAMPPRDFCFLGLATLVGWCVAEMKRPESDFWRGFEILGLCLWSYIAPTGRLAISDITVSEAYTVLNHAWHPHTMVAVMFFKQMAIGVTPILPLLPNLPWKRLVAIFPLLGAWAGGNLVILWVQKFYVSSQASSFLNDPSYEMTLWAIFFSVGILFSWIWVRLSEAICNRELGEVKRPPRTAPQAQYAN